MGTVTRGNLASLFLPDDVTVLFQDHLCPPQRHFIFYFIQLLRHLPVSLVNNYRHVKIIQEKTVTRYEVFVVVQ